MGMAWVGDGGRGSHEKDKGEVGANAKHKRTATTSSGAAEAAAEPSISSARLSIVAAAFAATLVLEARHVSPSTLPGLATLVFEDYEEDEQDANHRSVDMAAVYRALFDFNPQLPSSPRTMHKGLGHQAVLFRTDLRIEPGSLQVSRPDGIPSIIFSPGKK